MGLESDDYKSKVGQGLNYNPQQRNSDQVRNYGRSADKMLTESNRLAAMSYDGFKKAAMHDESAVQARQRASQVAKDAGNAIAYSGNPMAYARAQMMAAGMGAREGQKTGSNIDGLVALNDLATKQKMLQQNANYAIANATHGADMSRYGAQAQAHYYDSTRNTDMNNQLVNTIGAVGGTAMGEYYYQQGKNGSTPSLYQEAGTLERNTPR